MLLFWLDEHYDMFLTSTVKLVTNSAHLTLLHSCIVNVTCAKIKLKHVGNLHDKKFDVYHFRLLQSYTLDDAVAS